MGREERASEVFGAWYEGRELGAALPAEELIEAHPDLAEELRARLLALDLVDDVLRRERSHVPGELGPFRLLTALGSGGMGSVHLAETTRTAVGLAPGTRVALKVVHPHLLERAGFFQRFLREADLGRRVTHENVVRTHAADALVVDGRPHHFLVMEYVEGRTLRDLIAELDVLPESLCLHIAAEVAKGLDAIHAAGAVHRDLKPDNVLVTEEHVVKIMDLGIARIIEESLRLSQTGVFVGSLPYAAPEQFGGRDDVDARADLHALGVLLYECATGVQPFDHDDVGVVIRRVLEEKPRRLGEVSPQVSPFFEELVHALLAKDPRDRIPTADAVVAILREGEASSWWRDQVLALREARGRPLRRIRVPRETAVYGRSEDLDRLSALYRSAVEGDGCVVLLEGEAGIGKTRLVDEFVACLEAAGEEPTVLVGQHPPGGAATATDAVSEVLRAHFGEHDLDASVAGVLPKMPALVAAFAAHLRGVPAPPGALALKLDALRACFVEAVRTLAAERPTILVIEDLHFAPEEGRALFSALARTVPEHAILLIGTTRPEVPASWKAGITRLEHTTHRVLDRLGPKDLFALLEDTFHSAHLAEQLGMRIAVKSDGNPFFVFEIIRGLREGQLLRQRPDGTWETTQIIEQIEVPSSVLDLVNARVADLLESERNLLDVAACGGYAFDPDLVAEVLDLPRIPALQLLAGIEKRHRLVRSSGRQFVFDHHQVQEALYEALPQMLREEYHAGLAVALERREGVAERDPGSLEGDLTVALCEHYLRGARPTAGLRYLRPAVRHLKGMGRPGMAADLCGRVLAVPDLLVGLERADAIVLFASTAEVCGRYEEAARSLLEAVSLSTAVGDARQELAARQHRGTSLQILARHEEALAELKPALELTQELGDRRNEGRVLATLGNVHDATGDSERALDCHRRSLAIAEETSDDLAVCAALGHIAGVLVKRGRQEEAISFTERQLALAKDLGDPETLGIAHGVAGSLAWHTSDLAGARAHYRQFVDLARQAGFRRGETVATGNLGAVAHELGDLEDAETQFRRQEMLAREIGYPRGAALAVGNLGALADRRGDPASALPQLRRSVEQLRELEAGLWLCEGLLTLAEALLAVGDVPAARETAAEAASRARDLEHAPGAWRARLLLGEALRGAGDEPGAQTAFEAVRSLAREAEHGEGLGEASWRLARANASGGDHTGARAVLERDLAACADTCSGKSLLRLLSLSAGLRLGRFEDALEALAEHGLALHLHDRMEFEYRAWLATGEAHRLAEAKRMLDHFVGHAGPAYAESVFAAVPLHREIRATWAEHGE